ncbi:MAG: hypothetical protein WC651_05495 [Candidatus Gracilibacteria bacterium]|jgi:hypothetical protein
MNKFIRATVGVFAVLIFLSGCSVSGSNPAKDGDKIIKEGLDNFYDLTAADFDGALKGVQKSSTGDTTFDISFSGSGDIKDPKNILLNLKFDGSGALDKQSENVSGEMKINKSDLYFFVSKISSFGGMISEDISKPLIKQWWKTQLPQDMVDSLKESAAFGDESKLTPEEKKSRELLKETQFFSGAKYIGEENGDYRYETTLDPEAVKTYVEKSAEIYGETTSEDQLKAIDENFKNTHVKAEFWVGATDKTVHKFNLNINVDDSVADIKMDATLNFSVNNIDKPVTVEAPKDAKEFDPNVIFGGVTQ